jgi:tetratricopeptide (TPR) repeat protein
VTDARAREIAVIAGTGRIREARAAAEAAIATGQGSEAMLALAGMLAGHSGDAAAAIVHFRALLARNPTDRATRINLAVALTQTGAYDEVEAVCVHLAGDPAADRLRAFAAQQGGSLAQAAELYAAVVAAKPDDTDSWNNLANVRAALGATDEAIEAYEQAITLRPGDPRIYINLAGVLERADRREARRRTMRDAVRAAPNDAPAHLALGLAEAGMADMAAAEAALRRAIALAPGDGAAYLELGLLLENQNRLQDLDALIAVGRPRIGPEIALLEAWSAFRGKRFDEAKAAAGNIPDTVNAVRRLNIQAAIADRECDAEAAFALYAGMNAASVAASPALSGGPTYREKVNAERDRFARAAWRTGLANDEPAAPILVVGFPRSGTTLIDTMLGAAPDLHVLEEQPLIPAIEARVPADECAATLDARTTASLRRQYFAALDAISPDHGGRQVVDKHPLHMARMPIIHRLFPDAPVLLVERHPFDVVLSCFIANFQLNHAMRSFTTLDEAARTYDAVFGAWTEAITRLPIQVHPVRYERLVENPEAELRAAMTFLGRNWNPQMLDNEAAARNRAHIRTASYAQVGEPIHARSIGRWRRYRRALEPVLPILAPWAENFGYEVD